MRQTSIFGRAGSWRRRAGAFLFAIAVLAPQIAVAKDHGIPARTLTAEQFHAGVQLLWNKILTRHPEPFRVFTKAEFQAEVSRLMHRTAPVSEARAFVAMSRLIGMMRDGHSWVSIDDNSTLFSRAEPLRFWQFSDGIHIRAAAPDHADLVGATVLAINGVLVKTAWARIRDAVGGGGRIATTRAQIYIEIPAFLRVLKLANSDDRATFRLRLANGETVTRTIPAIQYKNYSEVWNASDLWTTPKGWVEPAHAKDALWFARRNQAFWSRMLPDGTTLYAAFNRATTDPDNPWNPKHDKYRPFLDALFKQVARKDVTTLIIDLRNNNGGNSALWQPLVHRIIRTQKLYQPGRLFVITSRLTESAAVAWAVKIEMNAPALFVGEPTANPPNFDNDPAGWRRETYHIPGSAVNFRVADMKEQWSAATDDRWAIFPDVPVSLSWKDFANGRDPDLAAIADVTVKDATAGYVDSGGESLVKYPWADYQRMSQVKAMTAARAHRGRH